MAKQSGAVVIINTVVHTQRFRGYKMKKDSLEKLRQIRDNIKKKDKQIKIDLTKDWTNEDIAHELVDWELSGEEYLSNLKEKLNKINNNNTQKIKKEFNVTSTDWEEKRKEKENV